METSAKAHLTLDGGLSAEAGARIAAGPPTRPRADRTAILTVLAPTVGRVASLAAAPTPRVAAADRRAEPALIRSAVAPNQRGGQHRRRHGPRCVAATQGATAAFAGCQRSV